MPTEALRLGRIDHRERSDNPSLADVARTSAIAYVALSAVLVVAGLVLTHLLGPVDRWDEHVNGWLATHRSAGWDGVSRAGTFVANTLGVVVVAAAVTGLALIRQWGRTAMLLTLGLALEISVFLTVNYTVARPRPSAPHLGSTPSTYSFPSGHVAATFVLYGGIAVLVACRTRAPWLRTLACLVAVVLVGWVAFSRVYAAQHHPTDVIAGLGMGVGALGAAVLAIRPPWPTRQTPPAVRAKDRIKGVHRRSVLLMKSDQDAGAASTEGA